MDQRWGSDDSTVGHGRVTTPEETLDRFPRFGRLTRRVLLCLLAVIVLLGATGLLGVHTRSVSASAEGYTLTVRYAAVARAGLDVPWRVTVEHPGGFDDDIVLAVAARYFDIFESQAFHPEPDMSTGDGDRLFLTFAPPAGSTFSVDYDAYIQPSSQLSRDGDVALLQDDRPLVSVSYTTWLVP